MMKTVLYLVLFVVIVSGCKKEDTVNQLDCTFFELGECFSTLSLSGESKVITNLADYNAFEESIRRHFDDSCDTVYLPEIDFNAYFFVGTFTQTSGCSAEYSRAISYNTDTDTYTYNITVSSTGDCEMLLSSFNCAIVPKMSDNYVIDGTITYN